MPIPPNIFFFFFNLIHQHKTLITLRANDTIMDIPEYCDYCGHQYRGSRCYSCETNAQYAKHFTKCFMCGITSDLKLSLGEDPMGRTLQMAISESQQEDTVESIPEPYLLIRIMDGVNEKFAKCGGTSYDDEVERMICHGERIKKATAFTSSEAKIAQEEFSKQEISKHTAVLCNNCLKEKEGLLRKQNNDEKSIELWKNSWKRFEYGQIYPFSR